MDNVDIENPKIESFPQSADLAFYYIYIYIYIYDSLLQVLLLQVCLKRTDAPEWMDLKKDFLVYNQGNGNGRQMNTEILRKKESVPIIL